jgi:hypothetical protein
MRKRPDDSSDVAVEVDLDVEVEVSSPVPSFWFSTMADSLCISSQVVAATSAAKVPADDGKTV